MVEINQTELGDYIKQFIEERNMSVREAGRRTDISASYLSKLFHHTSEGNPKPSTLDKIARGLNMDRHELYNKAGFKMIDSSPESANDLEMGLIKIIDLVLNSTNRSRAMIDIYKTATSLINLDNPKCKTALEKMGNIIITEPDGSRTVITRTERERD